MTDFYSQISALSPKRLALLALELKERLDAREEHTREPIAVVGLGCRFPGADSPDALARLLDEGRDAIGEVPRDRWDIARYFNVDPDVPGTMNTRFGGFLDGIDRFDPAHFGISPREAAGMDPQQRLFLEVAWEALEHAGIAPDRLAGTQTGVFLGIATLDYASLMMQGGDASLDLYSSSGGSHAVAAGRLSYILGLQGPALSVDTACSSSLVAVHLACQSLHALECDTALVGGVNVICAPETTLMLSRARMMAPDGRCKTFDERADGFVRGEGCGVLVLRRLSAAREAGDRILAVIRGSAVNQDGRSSGLTAPNGPAQEAVIRAALASAGIAAADVGYVEAHGTGTALGDPIELRALGATYGVGRSPENALIASSVKTNVGHLEAAAGVAGLAKAILSLHRERIPAHLHMQTPTSHVDWAALGVRLPRPGGEAWPRREAPRFAAVSSFGFSGTNAHVILEEAPLPSTGPAAAPARSRFILPIAGRTTAAVRELAGRYAQQLDDDAGARYGDFCDAAAIGRAQLTGARAVVLAAGAADAVPALRRMAHTEGAALSEQVANATVYAVDALPTSAADVAFVFTGQGGAHVGMGRALFEDAPVFHDAITRLDAPFRQHTGVSLIAVLYGNASAEFLRPEVSATALVAFQIALADLWRSWSIEPAAVAGHSLGEYAAAVTAGALSADDALRLVAARGRAIGALPTGEGAMAIVDASLSVIEDVIGAPLATQAGVEIAAVNAPEQHVLTGPTAAIVRLEALLLAHDIRVRRLGGVSHAYHSALLDPMLPAFRVACASATPRAPIIDWVSCLTGEAQSAAAPVDMEYWSDQMRQPVQWRRVVETLATRGTRVIIEVGPTAVLSGLSRASLEAAGVSTVVSVPSMRAGVDEWTTLLDALGRGWVHGLAVDWTRMPQGAGGRPELPTYPFQRQRYWLAPTAAGTDGGRGRRPRTEGTAAAAQDGLLGTRLPGPVATFPVSIDASAPAVVREHVVQGRALFAGSAFVDVALTAAHAVLGDRDVELRDIRFLAPLEVGRDDRDAYVTVERHDGGDATIVLSSRRVSADDADAWQRHTRATAVSVPASSSAERHTEPTVLMAMLPEVLDADAVYAAFRTRGIELGATTSTIQQLWRRDGESLAQLAVPGTLSRASRRAALFDGALQAFGVAASSFHDAADAAPRVLSRIGRVQLHADLTEATWCHARLTTAENVGAWTGALTLLDASGTIIASFEELSLVRSSSRVAPTPDRVTYALEWAPRALPDVSDLASCDILAAVAADALMQLGDTHGFGTYHSLIPVLEADALCYARSAFALLGIERVDGVLSDDALAVVLPKHWRLVRRLSAQLAAAGPAAATPAAGVPIEGSAPMGVDSLGRGERQLLDRCGLELADVLTGRTDPLDLLFPDGSFDALDRLYRDSPFALTYNGALREVLRAEVAARNGAPLRVLEIGAGTGGTTGFVLDALPTGSHYQFTDLSPLFLERARERFGEFPGVEYSLLDIEHDPTAQGLSAAGFDVVIASNVLHATADLRRTLEHVRRVAAPGALLMLLEATTPLRWVDVTFGLTDGWWRATDHELRPDHPLLDATQWVALLTAAGFSDVASAAGSMQSLFFARCPPSASTMPLLVLADAGGIGDALHRLVADSAGEIAAIDRSERDLDVVAQRIAQFRARHVEEVGVVYLWGLDVEGGIADSDAAESTAALFTEQVPLTVMRAVSAPGGAPARLWMVTRGAQAVAGGADVMAPEQAPLWGWSRGFSIEHPASCGACIDLDPAGDAAAAAEHILAEVRRECVEDQVAYRAETRAVARLVRRPAPAPATLTAHPDGAYLVTGGTGGLGLCVAEWLAEHGAGEVVLLSRSGLPDDPTDARQQRLTRLRERGCEVRVVCGDVADPVAMGSLVRGFSSTQRPLRGIVHAAVQMSSAPIALLDTDMLSTMRRSKIASTRVLDRLTADLALDFFVLFSSTTALLGVHGLAHYAAANQYLEAVAQHRRARAQAATSIAWGTWDVMRIASAEAQATIVRGGLHQLPSSLALELQGRLMADGTTTAVVADVDWQTLVPLYEARRVRPLIHELATTADVDSSRAADPVGELGAAPPSTADSAPLVAIRAATAVDRLPMLQHVVRREVAAVLGYGSSDGIPLERGFFELGLDSLMSVELKRRLESAVEHRLPSTLTFNYPNVSALAHFLDGELFTAAVPASPPPVTLSAPAATGTRDSDALTEAELEAELLSRLESLR